MASKISMAILYNLQWRSRIQERVQRFSIKPKPSSKRNPQANAILERVHDTVGNMIRIFELEEIELDGDNPFSGLIIVVGFAV